MLVTVDKYDFVVSVQSGQTESAIREIHRSEAMPEATQRCTGPFHAHSGRYEERPLSEFSINPKTNARYKTCDRCRTYAHPSTGKPIGRPKVAASVPALPGALLGGLQHKWEVTIVTTVTKTVYAQTYTEAGAEAGPGEIVNVRRLD